MQKFKDILVWAGLLAIFLSPLFFWLPLDHYDPWTSLGQVSALIGLVMYSVNIVLSSFVPQWRKHHMIGGIAFILIMLHPLFLAAALVPSGAKYAMSYILPGDNWMINLGIISLLLTMILLFLTFLVILPYKYWKLTHKFLGLAFFLGVLHGFLVESNLTREMPLKIYMLIVVSVGFLFWLKHSILDPIRGK